MRSLTMHNYLHFIHAKDGVTQMNAFKNTLTEVVRLNTMTLSFKCSKNKYMGLFWTAMNI
jgi:hypothetical protein